MKEILLRFKWHMLGLFVLIVMFVVRAFGSSSKQEQYKQVIEDFLKSKRDELHKREDKLSDSIVASEEAKIEEVKLKDRQLLHELEFRNQSGRKIDSRATNQRLRELGLK